MKRNILNKVIELNRKHPELFSERILKSPKLEPHQLKIIHGVRDHERVAVSACHDVGKTFTAGEVALWFLYNFAESKVITTAPTFRQVELLLWKEIHKKVQNAGGTQFLGGKLTNTRLEIAPDWFAVGFKPDTGAETGSGQQIDSNFQGIHAKYILVIFDEATGIPKSIWDQVEGMLTSGYVRFLAIGNPTDPTSEFAKCFKDPFYFKIRLSCFDSPNFKANGITNLQLLEKELHLLRELDDAAKLKRVASYKVVNQHLLSVRWVMERALKWGTTHPLFVSKCLGEFPDEADNVLIPLRVVEAAQRRRGYEPTPSDRRTIGVDVARFGSDETIITRMHGPKVLERVNLVKRDTSQVTGAVIDMIRHSGGVDVIVVDGTGIGAGVVDQLRQAQQEGVIGGAEIREVHFGASPAHDEAEDEQKAYDKEHFANLKAKMFQLLADDLKNNIELPEHEIYLEELPTIIYRFDGKGKLVIESKDEYKKRTGRGSPDNTDSLILANYGRYEELSVGALSDTEVSATPTVAGSLHSGDQW